MSETIKIEVASPPDREHLVAQIIIGNEQWAEINQEGERLQLEVYPRQDGKPWILDLDDAIRALADAQRGLVAR